MERDRLLNLRKIGSIILFNKYIPLLVCNLKIRCIIFLCKFSSFYFVVFFSILKNVLVLALFGLFCFFHIFFPFSQLHKLTKKFRTLSYNQEL
jgi:hypothetical protein